MSRQWGSPTLPCVVLVCSSSFQGNNPRCGFPNWQAFGLLPAGGSYKWWGHYNGHYKWPFLKVSSGARRFTFVSMYFRVKGLTLVEYALLSVWAHPHIHHNSPTHIPTYPWCRRVPVALLPHSIWDCRTSQVVQWLRLHASNAGYGFDDPTCWVV